MIRSEGFEVRLFESSERFLAEVSETPAGCVVLDITMPKLSGINLQKRLNERGIHMPIIVLTARDDDATRREAKQCGAKFYFRKPVDERTLIDAINWATNSEPDENSA